ncbi:hypothetical protein [Chryseobacterium shandongense]|uniref:hypothetical protein n=1 Tax=Chryseobacterium shandongense TaxID=1493872 RepID=UPI000F4EBB6D|nr:hypothetical protein [Chryseobacterium shandongense]AZA56423.1 hypothetical protein EG350_04170 [Chryseobacterium shandongense]
MFTTQFSDYPEFQILGVSLAAAFPAARVATFTSIFLQAKRISVTIAHAENRPFRICLKIISSSIPFQFQKPLFLQAFSEC